MMNKEQIEAHRVNSDEIVYAPDPDVEWPEAKCYSSKTLVCEILTDILNLTLLANPKERQAITEKIAELHMMHRTR